MKSTTTLVHDTAFAYDMLAIAAIKVFYNSFNSAAYNAYAKLYTCLSDQHGQEDHDLILDCPEYERLYTVNEEMYLRIDEMKTREATGEDARYIDDRVYQRYLAKKALQERWFPGAALTETKHGYTDSQPAKETIT